MTYQPKHPTLQTAKASVVAGAAAGGTSQRARLLAYGYLRGKGYRQIESYCHQGGLPEYERCDFDGPGNYHLRREASSYVVAWCRGDVEPTRDPEKWWLWLDEDDAVTARLKKWAACARCGHAVVRCPDLPGATDGSVNRVGTPTPPSGRQQAAPGLLAQVRDWLID